MKFNNPIELPSLKAKLKSVACLGEERGLSRVGGRAGGEGRGVFHADQKTRRVLSALVTQ